MSKCQAGLLPVLRGLSLPLILGLTIRGVVELYRKIKGLGGVEKMEQLIMVIDRIVSGIAVCELSRGKQMTQIQLPAEEIPEAEEGACYQVIFERDRDIEENRRKAIREMQEKLMQRSID